MAAPRVFPGLLVPVAFQTMSLSNSTSVAVNSTVRNALPSMLLVSIETQDARYRSDGTDPTLTTGVLLVKSNLPHWLPFDRGANHKFQRTTGTCKVSIMAFKNQGD